jgi:hypothetical protein
LKEGEAVGSRRDGVDNSSEHLMTVRNARWKRSSRNEDDDCV